MPDELKSVMVQCDRCGKDHPGLESDAATAGFYRVSKLPWNKYRRGDTEMVVCDGCMWASPDYLADYPHMLQPGDTMQHVDAQEKIVR